MRTAAFSTALAIAARGGLTSALSSPTPISASTSQSRISLGTLSVSPVGFGTLNLPLNKAEGDDNFVDVMRAAKSAGVNLVDTAEAYGFGSSERLTRWAANRAGLRVGVEEDAEDSMLVATKFAPVPWRPGAQSVVDACRASAERLGVESIDLYQIHFPDIIQPLKGLGIENRKDELYWEGLAECHRRGLARNVGVSNYGPTMIRRAHAALAERGVPLVSNQINFSLVRYKSSMETLRACDELGIRVLAYFPLGNGLLAGKYDLDDPSTLPSFPKSLTMNKYLEGTVPLMEELRAVASQRDRTCAQVAINWVVQKGLIPIPGCRNDRHATDNFAALDFGLTDEEVGRLDRASEESMEFSSGGFELE